MDISCPERTERAKDLFGQVHPRGADMEKRCKHDLLPGQCSFCQGPSSEAVGHVNGQEFVAWLGRFNQPPKSGVLAQRSHKESPQPGASAGSTANPAISRRRL